jgi:cellobiose-specific phosphotransferase system component IIC
MFDAWLRSGNPLAIDESLGALVQLAQQAWNRSNGRGYLASVIAGLIATPIYAALWSARQVKAGAPLSAGEAAFCAFKAGAIATGFYVLAILLVIIFGDDRVTVRNEINIALYSVAFVVIQVLFIPAAAVAHALARHFGVLRLAVPQ